MITTTIGDLLEAVPILQEMSNYEFKAKVAFKIARIIQASDNELKNFNHARYLIFEKYGEVDENNQLKVQNQNITIKKDDIPDYNKDMTDLLNTPIELVANPIEIDELDDMNFTPLQLAKMSDFIVE